jgi:hypothetical protein
MVIDEAKFILLRLDIAGFTSKTNIPAFSSLSL